MRICDWSSDVCSSDLSAIRSVGPASLSSEKKVFGYVGTIASWFDWDMVSALAEARPDGAIRLIGPVFQPPPRKLHGNVHLMPACGPAEALTAMAEFHVGLITFKKNAITVPVATIQYYERYEDQRVG